MHKIIIRFIRTFMVSVFFCLLALQPAFGDTTRGKWSFIPIAAPFYTPDTSWGGGAFLLAYRDVILDSDRETDQIGLFGTYTMKDQKSIGVSPDIILNREYRLTGKFAYQNSSSDFWGLGPDTRESDLEQYTAEELLAEASLLRKFSSHLYLGPKVRFRYTDITETEEGSILSTGEIAGSETGHEAGYGVRLIYDTTDSTFYPASGMLAESFLLFNTSAAGSDYDYTDFMADVRYYIGLSGKHVLAFQGVAEICSDGVPLQSMSTLGGSMIMRGLPQNRYMDINSLAFQAEYRFPLVWRLAGAVFASAGTAGNSLDDFFLFSDYRHAYGAGLRYVLDMEKNIAIRIDFGYGGEGLNAYFLFREAF